MVIEGDPGMGKTRLLEELEHESMAQNQPDVEGTPSSHGDLSAIRKMCNIFAANGDLANKSKVHTLTCHALPVQAGWPVSTFLLPAFMQCAGNTGEMQADTLACV